MNHFSATKNYDSILFCSANVVEHFLSDKHESHAGKSTYSSYLDDYF